MRCKACNAPIERLRYYNRLRRHEDLCRRCFTAAARATLEISAYACHTMLTRSVALPDVQPKKEHKKVTS